MISIYQIYFSEDSRQHLDPKFIPYFNPVKDDYFENAVIAKIYKEKESELSPDDFIGITSWKQNTKTNLVAEEIFSHIQKDVDAGTEKDVYIYSPLAGCEIDGTPPPIGFDINGIIKAPDIWHFHKNLLQPYKDGLLLNNEKVLPFDIYDGKWQYCYCNYWAAKKKVFDDYCKNALLPALEFFERPDIKSKIHKWYYHEGGKVNSCSFILEGLFGSFLAHSNYSYSYIYKKKIAKFDAYHKINILRYDRIGC